MKLFVVNPHTRTTTYLSAKANSRLELVSQFGGEWFTINDGYTYHISEVWAEAETSSTAAGAVIGGLIGLLGGPLGLIVGAGIGGTVGNSSDTSEVHRVNVFNNS